MAATVLGIAVACAIIVAAWLFYRAGRNDAVREANEEAAHKRLMEKIDALIEERDELLRQKREIQYADGALRNRPGLANVVGTPFEKPNDKIQPKLRYRPIGERRAQAEAASMGPQTHSEQVVANNTQALEQA